MKSSYLSAHHDAGLIISIALQEGLFFGSYTKGMQHLNYVLRLLLPKFLLERWGSFTNRGRLFFQGTWPLFRAQNSLRKSARNPRTFNEKILYKMAFDRRDLLTDFADKVAVRKIVHKLVGDEYLTDLYAVFSLSDLDLFCFKNLPRNFVIKVSHGSGGVIIVSDKESKLRKLPQMNEIKSIGWSRFSIHPDNFDSALVKAMLSNWLTMSYFWYPGFFPEWAYKNIQPQVLIEEFLGDKVSELNDYRFYIFNGRCEFIATGPPFYSRMGMERNFYTVDWELLPVLGAYPNCTTILDPPKNLDEMIKVSESLARGIDHIRVDLYSIGERTIFGELTNYSNSGREKFTPDLFNYEFGKSWHPEKLY